MRARESAPARAALLPVLTPATRTGAFRFSLVMHLIHAPLPHSHSQNTQTVLLKVDRLQLAKRRWRGVAEDGTEFGFDLEHPLHDGESFFATSSHVYAVEQLAESIIDIQIPQEATEAARIGWMLGNLHFPVSIHQSGLRVNDDPAIRQMLDREHIHYHLDQGVFHPISGGHSHAH